MYTQKKPIDNTHIVREKDRQRNRELLAVLFLGVPIGLFLLLFTWQNLEVIRLGREATRLQKMLKQTEATHKALEGELDRLTSFEAVEKQAQTLGFKAAPPQTIVMVEASGPGVPNAPRVASASRVIPSVVEGSPADGAAAAKPAGDPST
ncbi:MAG: hypothetical protein M3Q69_17980, partial [Acidobacteriota bacterium]|nr:hypothetical protein [Acidobacteriota bacterium]